MELQRELAVLAGEFGQGDRLTITCILAPDQRDFYACTCITLHNNASGIGFSFAYCNAVLLKPMWSSWIKLDQRCVITAVGLVGVHRDKFITTNGLPETLRSTTTPFGNRRQRWWTGCDGIIELAISEHLGPHAFIDDIPAMFQKLSIDILRNRCTHHRGI